jgi:predicted transposase YbfD/YdcC
MRRRIRQHGHRRKIGQRQRPAQLPPPAEQLARVDAFAPRHFGSHRTRLQRRSDDPLLLLTRPPPAPLHRRHHLDPSHRHGTTPRISPITSAPSRQPRKTALTGGLQGHGRIEQRTVTVAREVDWLTGERRFPGETRLPDINTLIRVATRTELKDRSRFETRYYVSSATLTAARAQHVVRSHWAIENRLHWIMDVVFRDDQCRLRIGHGARNMTVVRHFALNLVRAVADKKPIKRRRKLAGWSADYLEKVLQVTPR